ncbi:SUR7-domain-containing protein [Dothidotthia symphoricarpi CBS 119687]|uniref:SUR7-domain-containing protein n=1 Tax=Dothidotthia symphoricarpi CBS 119687 TaxID=1392245 RepID=A0A6A6AK37_9PLEO|nr:SUR7-domain-containing protein [Dothidotthia symphoricarpi CBS 119687]KAF2131916.1 SUR7-domain-containing protein [Dothidotthia symphoricarpi CBS 119687]
MAGPARPLLAIASLILLGGGILLQIFTILTGGINSAPLNRFYFLEASTSGISNARNPSRWTFFAICGTDPSTGYNANCGSPVPALPFDPPRNFGTTQGIPQQFIGTHTFYYLSRFMFAFYLIALFFAVIALFSGVLALCSRLGGYLSGMTTSVALFFQSAAAALLTVWVVKGRNAFRSSGSEAHIGKYLLAFAWASMACFFLATIMFCLGGALGGDRSSRKMKRNRSTRSNRSRGSFIETDSQRRVKDDYSV